MNVNNTRPSTGSLRLTERDMKRREEMRKWREENGFQEPSYSSATPSVISGSGSSSSGTKKVASSGYPGVYWNKSKNKYDAMFRKDGSVVYVGNFDDPEEANRALQYAKGKSSYSHSKH